MVSTVKVQKIESDPLKAVKNPVRDEIVTLFSPAAFSKHMCDNMHFMHSTKNYRFKPPENAVPRRNKSKAQTMKSGKHA